MTSAELLQIANDVKAYAQRYIKKGSTQLALQQSEMDAAYFMLNQAMRDLRTEMWLGDFNAFDNVDPDPVLFSFQHQLAMIRKYSLGNCHEFVLLAMEYLVDHHPDVCADEAHLGEGDHAILLLHGETSADDVICNPWADVVCLAKDALTSLSTYVANEEKGEHGVQRITAAALQQLLIVRHSATFAKRNSQAYHTSMKEVYLSKLKILSAALKALVVALTQVMARAQVMSAENEDKLAILSGRIEACQACIAEYDAITLEQIEVRGYAALRTYLQMAIQQRWQQVLALANFSTKEVRYLQQPDWLDRTRAELQGHRFAQSAALTGVKTALTGFEQNLEPMYHGPFVLMSPADEKAEPTPPRLSK